MRSSQVLLRLNGWVILTLDRRFQPMPYLNQESYFIEFRDKLAEHFLNGETRVNVFLRVEIIMGIRKIGELMSALENNCYVNKRTLNSRLARYEQWLDKSYKGKGGFQVEIDAQVEK